MTIREEIQERIAKLDDAALPALLEQLERFEKRGRFSHEFFDALASAHARNKDLSGDDALRLATEAVNADRQSRP